MLEKQGLRWPDEAVNLRWIQNCALSESEKRNLVANCRGYLCDTHRCRAHLKELLTNQTRVSREGGAAEVPRVAM
eukprot:9165229-Prorocentrum_lima.AAC.1